MANKKKRNDRFKKLSLMRDSQKHAWLVIFLPINCTINFNVTSGGSQNETYNSYIPDPPLLVEQKREGMVM